MYFRMSYKNILCYLWNINIIKSHFRTKKDPNHKCITRILHSRSLKKYRSQPPVRTLKNSTYKYKQMNIKLVSVLSLLLCIPLFLPMIAFMIDSFVPQLSLQLQKYSIIHKQFVNAAQLYFANYQKYENCMNGTLFENEFEFIEYQFNEIMDTLIANYSEQLSLKHMQNIDSHKKSVFCRLHNIHPYLDFNSNCIHGRMAYDATFNNAMVGTSYLKEHIWQQMICYQFFEFAEENRQKMEQFEDEYLLNKQIMCQKIEKHIPLLPLMRYLYVALNDVHCEMDEHHSSIAMRFHSWFHLISDAFEPIFDEQQIKQEFDQRKEL